MILDRTPRLLSSPPWWLVLLLGLAMGAAFQLVSDGLVGVDGWFHARLAAELLTHGFDAARDLVPFGLWSTHYADKEVGTHLLMAPFTLLGTVMGIKLFVIAVFGFVVLGAYKTFRALEVPFAAVFALALPLVSLHLLYRLQMPRAHIVAVALFIPYLGALVRRESSLVGLLSAAFALCYTAWHFFPLLALLVAVQGSLSARRIDPSPFVAALVGAAIGLVIHPHFPDSLSVWWIQNTDVVAAGWGGATDVTLGSEIFPGTTKEWLLGAPFLLVGLATTVVAALSRPLFVDEELRTSLLLAAVTAGMAMLSLRFVEYAIPASVLLMGLVVKGTLRQDTELLQGRHPDRALVRRRARQALGVVALVTLGAAGYAAVKAPALLDRTTVYSPAFLSAFAEAVAPGEVVVTCDWQTVPELAYADWEARYTTILDPMFLKVPDPDRYGVWHAASEGLLPDPGAMVTAAFGASWVVCPADHVTTRLLVQSGAASVAVSRGGHALLALGDTPPHEPIAWQVAGPVPPVALSTASAPVFGPSPGLPGFSGVPSPAGLLAWPPLLPGQACFLARGMVPRQPSATTLRLGVSGSLLLVTIDGQVQTPAPGTLVFEPGSITYPLDQGSGPVALQVGLCVDPAAIAPPYALTAWTE